MARFWLGSAAFMGSAALHLALFAFVRDQFNAREIAPQPTPSSQLLVQSEPIRQSTAQPAAIQGEQVAEQAATGTGLAAGTIPQNEGRAVKPATTQLTSSAAKAAQLTSERPPAVPLAAAKARMDVAHAKTLNPSATLSSTLPRAEILPVAQSVTPLAPSVSLPQTAARAAPTEATTLRDAPPAPQPVVARQPPATEITATLAFQGEDADLDAQSLAAFQSFTQPGDLTQDSDPLRDGVAQILSQVPCSRLQVAFDAPTTTLNVTGHVSDPALKAPVLALLQGQMGANIAVSDQMALLPRPQCGALQAIEAVGLAQSTDQITNPALLGADTHVRVFDFRAGELLFLDLTGPDYPAFVYVDYLDAKGTVLHLSPNEYAPLIELAEKQPFAVGARSGQEDGLQLVIAPPFGQEIVVAFAASHPLYDGVRPLAEPAAPYLEWLKDRVADARRNNPDFKGEWVYFLVSTGP